MGENEKERKRKEGEEKEGKRKERKRKEQGTRNERERKEKRNKKKVGKKSWSFLCGEKRNELFLPRTHHPGYPSSLPCVGHLSKVLSAVAFTRWSWPMNRFASKPRPRLMP